jgi:hypothetical protein
MSETDDYHPEDSLRAAGRSFWDSITEAHDLDGVQRVLLLEACRLTDHINDLHHAAMTDGKTLRVVEVNGRKVALTVKDPVRLYISCTKTRMSMLAAMRLPDETGKRPQRRGGARGPYQPRGS